MKSILYYIIDIIKNEELKNLNLMRNLYVKLK